MTTTMLSTLAKKDLATIKASAKAWDVLQSVIGLENYSEALALSYLDCLKEQLDAAGFSNDDYKSKLSKRKKVLLFAAGADKGQEGWSDIAIDLEAEAMLKQPSLETAYKYATESIKLAKNDPESEGEGEGESEGEAIAISEAKQALIRHAIDLITAMPENMTDDARDQLTALFEGYKA